MTACFFAQFSDVNSPRVYRVAHKTGKLCFVCLNFVRYWLIFKLISLSESGEYCNDTISKDPTTPQVCRYTTLWNVNGLRQQLKTKRLL